MPGRYAPLPNPTRDADAERELEGAFATSDDEDDERGNGRGGESAPLMGPPTSAPAPSPAPAASTSGAYDFEAVDWIAPPPGSPPAPSSFARPNDYGNTNGITGTEPARPSLPRPTFFRRVAGVLLPQHYARVPTSEAAANRVVGGGITGVFNNIVAKPSRPVEVRDADGSVHIVPEITQREPPPSYASARLDNAPPYWDATAAIAVDPYAEVMLEDLPVGTFIMFACNVFISFFFQFVGFLMTYIMSTTHAAKYGSRVGLGLTMIQYGYFSRQAQLEGAPEETQVYTSNGTAIWQSTNGTVTDGPVDEETLAAYSTWLASREWIAFIFMALGWFIVLTSCIGFFRVKRYEQSLRASITAPAADSEPTPEQVARANATHRAIARAFGFQFSEPRSVAPPPVPREPTPEEREAEARLRQDLEAAGFI